MVHLNQAKSKVKGFADLDDMLVVGDMRYTKSAEGNFVSVHMRWHFFLPLLHLHFYEQAINHSLTSQHSLQLHPAEVRQ